jgi:hypothetical protein
MRLIIVLISVCASFCAYSQISLGVKAGVNINQLSITNLPDPLKDNSKPSVGLNFGVYSKINLSGKFSLIPEILFSNKGARTDGALESRINYNYITMPVLVSFSLPKIVSFDLGPFIGYKAWVSTRSNGSTHRIKNYGGDENFDFGIAGGIRAEILPKLSAIVRYHYSFVPADYIYFRDDQNNPSGEAAFYNRNVELSLAYKVLSVKD